MGHIGHKNYLYDPFHFIDYQVDLYDQYDPFDPYH